MKGFYATDAEIQDSFQNIKRHSTAGIQALNNFLFEFESLEKSTVWANVGKFLLPGKLQNYGSAQGAWKFTRNSKVLRKVTMSDAT